MINVDTGERTQVHILQHVNGTAVNRCWPFDGYHNGVSGGVIGPVHQLKAWMAKRSSIEDW